VTATQRLDHAKLSVVGVLVLVHQHVLEALRVVFGGLRSFAEEPHDLGDEIIEVERRALAQRLFVERVGFGHPLLERRHGHRHRFSRRDQRALGVADLAEVSYQTHTEHSFAGTIRACRGTGWQEYGNDQDDCKEDIQLLHTVFFSTRRSPWNHLMGCIGYIDTNTRQLYESSYCAEGWGPTAECGERMSILEVGDRSVKPGGILSSRSFIITYS